MKDKIFHESRLYLVKSYGIMNPTTPSTNNDAGFAPPRQTPKLELVIALDLAVEGEFIFGQVDFIIPAMVDFPC